MLIQNNKTKGGQKREKAYILCFVRVNCYFATWSYKSFLMLIEKAQTILSKMSILVTRYEHNLEVFHYGSLQHLHIKVNYLTTPKMELDYKMNTVTCNRHWTGGTGLTIHVHTKMSTISTFRSPLIWVYCHNQLNNTKISYLYKSISLILVSVVDCFMSTQLNQQLQLYNMLGLSFNQPNSCCCHT